MAGHCTFTPTSLLGPANCVETGKMQCLLIPARLPQKKHQEKTVSVTSKAKYSCDSRSSGEKSKAVSCCLCVNIVHTLIKMCVSAAGVVLPTMTSSEETTWAAIFPPSCKAPVCSTETSSTSASTTRSEFHLWPPPGHYPPLCSRVKGQHLSNRVFVADL